MKQHATYIFDCGYLIPEHKLFLNKYGRRKCPNHAKAKLVKRTSFCKICGEYIEQLSNRGRMPSMCKRCQAKDLKEKANARRKKEKKAEKAVIGDIDQLSETHKPVVLTRRTDCKHYLTKCLSWYFLRDKNATCDGCKMYEYLELDPINYAYNRC